MIPATYSEWRICIEQRCALKLTAAFIAARIEALSDPETPDNKAFIQCYGPAHHQRILSWLQQAEQEL